MGVNAAPSRTVLINNWSLVFSDPQVEQDFRVHQRQVWASTEQWRLKMNLLAGLNNLSITTYMLSLGNVFTKQGASIVLPYMTVAVLHYCLSKWQKGSPRSIIINHIGEACYSLICVLSMPTWVLHGDCVELKVFLRKLILGSGVLIGCWVRFLIPTFFHLACVLTPLQFAFQAWHLTQTTCSALLTSPYSTRALQQLLQSLDSIASWCLHGTLHANSNMRSSMDPAVGCQSLVIVLQLFIGGALLYMSYRMELSNRQAFLQGKLGLVRSWPYVPVLVQVVLHCVVCIELFTIMWAVLQGFSGSMGTSPVRSAA